MGNWGMAEIRNIAMRKLEYGSGASAIEYDGQNRYVRITDINDAGRLSNNPASPSTVDEKYRLQDGDILFARSGATVGKTFLYQDENGPCIYAGYLIRLVLNKKVANPKYVFYYTKSPIYRAFIESNSRVVAQPNINAKQYGELEIPLPPLAIQKQIAQTLDTAAELLGMRKQQLAELDNLIKSTFYDMFGDPVTNEKGWETIVLNDCLDKIESGWSPICENRSVIEEEWGVCKLSAVTGGSYKENENKSILKDTEIKLALRVVNDDLLFSRKNTSQLVGSCAYVFESTRNLMIPDTIFRLCTKGNIQKLYLWGLINCQTFKPIVQQLAGGTSGSMPNISKERLKRLEIPLPAFSKQKQFTEIVTKIEEQKTLVKKAIDETRYLFDSLMAEYFE